MFKEGSKKGAADREIKGDTADCLVTDVTNKSLLLFSNVEVCVNQQLFY